MQTQMWRILTESQHKPTKMQSKMHEQEPQIDGCATPRITNNQTSPYKPYNAELGNGKMNLKLYIYMCVCVCVCVCN